MSNVLANKLRGMSLLTDDQAAEALNVSAKDDQPFLKTVERLNFGNEAEIINSISFKSGIVIDENVLENVDLTISEKLSFGFSKRYNAVLYKEDQNYLYVAVLDPFDRKMLENIRIQSRTNKIIEPVLVKYDTMIELLSLLEDSKNDVGEEVLADEYTEEEVDIEALNIAQRVDAAPIVKTVDSIIVDAYRGGVSDIHIEPEDKNTVIRFRVDGTLHIHKTFNKRVHNLICSRIKIISGLDPSNRNQPQDGSFTHETEYTSVDLRVSVLPVAGGEKVVMRLLGADKNINYDLHSLGLRPYVIESIEKAIKVPNGIILVTGPTGSGKTTTLYTILNKLATPETSLVTVEDPVEKNIEGVSQVQVSPKAGLGFAESLRSILRQDPDTIMIGEMRDQETAQISTRAAITGHLVLSTIHTNDAISTVSRLIDMGVEPYMISSSLKCVIAQRLVKKVCEHCKEEHVNTDIEKNLLKVEDNISYVGTGCEKCKFTGYSGRTAVFEILMVDGELARMIANDDGQEKMTKYVASKGTRTMRQEVLELVNKGTTSIDEAINILYTID